MSTEVSSSDEQPFYDLVLKLHSGASSIPSAQFNDWALERLQSVG